MTEITANFDKLPWRRIGTKPRYVIDPVAFFIALIGGPLLVAAAGFWIVGVPVFAVAFGGPVYLAVGTPLLLIYLRRAFGKTGDIIALGFFALIAMAFAAGGWALLTDNDDLMGIVAFYSGFGIIFAPLWAGAFGWIYNKLRNDLSRAAH